MSDAVSSLENRPPPRKQRPFRRAVLRGLGLVLPPLLTVVVFLWAWSLIESYVLQPMENLAERVILSAIWDVRTKAPAADEAGRYRALSGGQWIPVEVYDVVDANPGEMEPVSARAYFGRYVHVQYLRRSRVIPLFLASFILILYFVGKFLAAGIGRWFWNTFEGLIRRLPLVRNVYSSVKQVTDLVFSEQELKLNRVVAVEYPRKGIWSLAFVMSEGLLDIRAAANEPVVTLFVPSSCMVPIGFTVTVRKSEIIDLNITLDQALQFYISCGVVIPGHQQYHEAPNGRPIPAPASTPAPGAPSAAIPLS